MQTLTKPYTAITPATHDDIPIIIALAQRIWPVAYGNILTPGQIDNMLERIYSANNLRKEMAEGHQFWLAYDANAAVGFISAYKNDTTVWIKKVYVDMAMQGKGIGARLIETAVAAFPSTEEIRLYVNRDNKPAHHFYERLGFIHIGEEPVQMGDGQFCDFVFSKKI